MRICKDRPRFRLAVFPHLYFPEHTDAREALSVITLDRKAKEGCVCRRKKKKVVLQTNHPVGRWKLWDRFFTPSQQHEQGGNISLTRHRISKTSTAQQVNFSVLIEIHISYVHYARRFSPLAISFHLTAMRSAALVNMSIVSCCSGVCGHRSVVSFCCETTRRGHEWTGWVRSLLPICTT